MTETNIRLFVDFDGTITEHDIGDSIFETFLDPVLLEQDWHNNIIKKWKQGKLSSFECLKRECAHTKVSPGELDRHIDKYSLTPGFAQTADYCKTSGIPLMILSDGLDYYIQYLLEKNGLSHLDFKANHLIFKENCLDVEFPHKGKGCGRCGNCKRWHMKTLSEDGELIIYVGDGYSDRYAIRNADVVFARGDLIEYCRNNGIEYKPFNDFFDVLEVLRKSY